MQQIACMPQGNLSVCHLISYFCMCVCVCVCERQFNNFFHTATTTLNYFRFVEGSSYRAFEALLLRSNMQLVNINFHWQHRLNEKFTFHKVRRCHWKRKIFTEVAAHIFGMLTHKYLKCFDAFYICISTALNGFLSFDLIIYVLEFREIR